MASSWFDESYYLSAKATYNNANAIGGLTTWTPASVQASLNAAGMTAEQHYSQYGWTEGLAPNAYYVESQYVASKVAALNAGAVGGKTDWTPADFYASLNGANPFMHYVQYGAYETGVEPSTGFNDDTYYADKAAYNNANNIGGITTWDAAQVKTAFQAAGLTPIGHYELYGQSEGFYTPTPIPSPGQTFTLTTNVETVPSSGTLGTNAVVNGVLINGIANGQTYQTGDIINGAATNDTSTVNINVLADTANIVDINNVNTVNYKNVSGAATTLANQNATLWSGVKNFTSTESTDTVALGNGELATNYKLISPVIDAAAGLTVGYRASDITGASDTGTLTVNNAGRNSGTALVPTPATSTITINNNSTGSTATGVENFSLNATGTNDVRLSLGTNAKTLTVSGDGNNTFTINAGDMLASGKTIDLSDSTGTNSVRTAVGTNDTITGGSGADTLRVDMSGLSSTSVTATDVETLRVDSSAAGGTIAFATTPNFATVRVDSGAGGGVNQLLNVGSFNTLQFNGSVTTASSSTAQTFDGVTATGAFTGTSDALAIKFANGGTTLTNATPYTTGTVTANGVESASLTVADAQSSGTTTLGGLVSNTLTSFDATSNGTVAVTTLNGTNAVTGGSLTAIDFSKVTGTSAVSTVSVTDNSLAAASTITAGAGGLTATVLAETATDVLTFNGGAGVDTLTGTTFTGIVNFKGLGGADIADVTAAASEKIVYTSVTDMVSETGSTWATADTITGFTVANGSIQTGTAGTAGNFGTATNDYANTEATVLGAANGILDGTVRYASIVDTDAAGGGTNAATYLYVDTNLDGTADAVTRLLGAGITLTSADII